MNANVLSHEQAKGFYDRFGARQDTQRFYENRALETLVAHSDFGSAHAVFEYGCGTGRFAVSLLSDHLPPNATYRAVDVSATMVGLTHESLVPFGDRVQVDRTDGAPVLAPAEASVDRFISNYVLDLLSPADIRLLLNEAHRLLCPNGFLCLISLTHGEGIVSRLLTGAWARVQAFHPALVGGCRPIVLTDYVSEAHWHIRFHRIITAFGIPSEVLVAEPVAG